jgi:hypothetical protein
MRKIALIFIISFFTMSLFCQIKRFEEIPTELVEQLDKMGIEDSCILTDLEGKYLNFRLNINKDVFNFCEKKMAFFNGKLGNKKSNKQVFFADEKRRKTDGNFPNPIVFYLLVEKPKGYDAVIVFWYIKVPSVKSIIKNL